MRILTFPDAADVAGNFTLDVKGSPVTEAHPMKYCHCLCEWECLQWSQSILACNIVTLSEATAICTLWTLATYALHCDDLAWSQNGHPQTSLESFLNGFDLFKCCLLCACLVVFLLMKLVQNSCRKLKFYQLGTTLNFLLRCHRCYFEQTNW